MNTGPVDAGVDSTTPDDRDRTFALLRNQSFPSQGKHSKPRVVISHITPGERVHPESAYLGTKNYDRAVAAKPESEVLKNFLVNLRRF